MNSDATAWVKCLSVALGAVFLAVSCAPVPPRPAPPPPPPAPPPVLQRLPVDDYPQFKDSLDTVPLIRSIEKSLAFYRRQPAERRIAFGPDAYTVAHLVHSLAVFKDMIAAGSDMAAINQRIREQFAVYRSAGSGKGGKVLFTGFYEAVLRGSLSLSDRYRIPVYSRPSDLLSIDLAPFGDDLKGRTIVGRYTGRTVVPYPTREQIRRQPDFSSIAPPIAWLENDYDLFNLQIQGSGRLQLDNGDQVHILYDGSNDRPYRSIGRLLIDQGHISRERLSMQSIRAYLQGHPERVEEILNHNPRYVFFRLADDGPMGAMGRQPLTPLRSIAIDRRIFPLGALAYIETPLARVNAEGVIDAWDPFGGFVLAQDTGGAITGPGRVDLFMGHGLRAETAAGHLKHPGDLYFLVLDADTSLPGQ